jgi:hypothetical protein
MVGLVSEYSDSRSLRRPAGSPAIEFLDDIQTFAETLFADRAAGMPIDGLVALLRRFPPWIFPIGWLPMVTLGLEKHAAKAGSVRLVSGDRSHWLEMKLSESDFDQAFELAMLAQILVWLAGARRWVGKGARLDDKRKPWQTTSDEQTEEAVTLYENRRGLAPFADQGVVTGPTNQRRGHLLLAGMLSGLASFHVPERDISLTMNYIPVLYEADLFWSALEPYRAAIEELHNVELEDVFHVLAAVSDLAWSTMRRLEPDKAHGVTLASGGDPEVDDHKLGFTFHLLQGAYLRRSRSEWMAEIGRTATPWRDSGATAIRSAERVFDAFTLEPGEASHLDLTALRPYPLLFQAPSGGIYFDFCAVRDWLSSLLGAGQDWFESQHGDHFHLAVTKTLKRLGRAEILPKWAFVDDQGRRREGDLLVGLPDQVLCVECKAFRKHANYWRGDSSIISKRQSRLAAGLRQAQEAADAILDGRSDAVATDDRTVVAAVCTPGQEFIKPVDRFGWLAPGVPTVCTLEELAAFVEERTKMT